jgi:hypothetical protein
LKFLIIFNIYYKVYKIDNIGIINLYGVPVLVLSSSGGYVWLGVDVELIALKC